MALCRNGIGCTTGTGFCIARQCDCHWYVIGASNTHMDSHLLCIFAMPWVTLIFALFGPVHGVAGAWCTSTSG